MAKDTTGNVKVTLIKSTICKKASPKATVIGLGLRKINHTVELKDGLLYTSPSPRDS